MTKLSKSKKSAYTTSAHQAKQSAASSSSSLIPTMLEKTQADWEIICTDLHVIKSMSRANSWNLNAEIPILNKNCKTFVLFNSIKLLVNHPLFPPNGDSKHLILLGQPSIGKSTSVIAMMVKCMMLKKPFLLTEEGYPFGLYWSEEGGAEVLSDPSSWPTQNEDLTWFMNQKENGPYKASSCKIVIACSPKRDNYKEFTKWTRHTAKILFMPLPSIEEAKEVAMSRGLSEEEADKRIDMYGPALGSILDDPAVVDYDLTSAIELPLVTEGSAYLTCCLLHNIYDQNMYHKVFYEDNDENFQPRSIGQRKFGTPYIAAKYMDRWKRADRQSFVNFIHRNDYTSDRGIAFKQYCNDVFKTGGTFECHRLHGLNQTEDVPPLVVAPKILPVLNVIRITNAQRFQNNFVGHYLHPHYSNYPAVDSLIINPGSGDNAYTADLYQMTVSANHGMGRRALGKVINKLKNMFRGERVTWRYRLYYVVPQQMFAAFVQQEYNGTEDIPDIATGKPVSEKDLNLIEQFVLGVPVVV